MTREPAGLVVRGLRFGRRRLPVLAALAGWSLLETGQTFLAGYSIARALDRGFLADRPGTGLSWLAAAAVGILLGAIGSGRSFRGIAGLAEPLRDILVRSVVARGLRDASDTGAVSRLTQQVEIARDSFAGLVMVGRSFVFTAAGALLGMASLAPALLVVVVPPLVLGLALFALSLRPMARRQAEFLAADENIARRVGEVAAGMRDVVACGGQELAREAVAGGIDAELAAARSLARWSAVRVVALGIGGRLPVLLLLVGAPWLLARGATAGALVGAMTYLTQSLLPAMRALVHGFGAAGTRLTVVLRRLAVGGGPAPVGRPPLEPVAGAPALELRGVGFGYGTSPRPVVRGLDLTVPAGGHLAVVGPSGIGKSTLAELAAGMLRPQSGEIRLAGHPLPDRTPAELRRLRMLLPQQAYVFTGTVRDNLRYLCGSSVPDREVLAAAAAVGADGLLDRLGGLDAVLDPATLSAGQRQLLALTRGYLSPAPLALLDEATCHLDPAAEARAEQAFAARPGGTLLVVAHRVSSARRADRVLVMDGVTALCGRHDELLERSALYRDLVGLWEDSGSHPAGALGYPDGVHPVARPGLAVDGGHVVAHGAVAEMQPAGDLGDRGTLGGE